MSELVRGPALGGPAVGGGSYALPAEIRPLPATDGGVWLSPDASLLPLKPGTAIPLSTRPLQVGEDGVLINPGDAAFSPINLGGVLLDFDPADYQPAPMPTPLPTGLRAEHADVLVVSAESEGFWVTETVSFAFGGWLVL